MRAMALLLRIAAAREAAYLSEAPALLQCRLHSDINSCFRSAAACAMLSGVENSSLLQRLGSTALHRGVRPKSLAFLVSYRPLARAGTRKSLSSATAAKRASSFRSQQQVAAYDP